MTTNLELLSRERRFAGQLLSLADEFFYHPESTEFHKVHSETDGFLEGDILVLYLGTGQHRSGLYLYHEDGRLRLKNPSQSVSNDAVLLGLVTAALRPRDIRQTGEAFSNYEYYVDFSAQAFLENELGDQGLLCLSSKPLKNLA